MFQLTSDRSTPHHYLTAIRAGKLLQPQSVQELLMLETNVQSDIHSTKAGHDASVNSTRKIMVWKLAETANYI